MKEFKGQDTYDEIVNQLDELSRYTKYHFGQEEKLMAHYEYPEIDGHIKEHQEFIKYLDGLDYYDIDQAQEEALVDLLKFISSWVFKHIMNTDFKYSDFLVNKMHEAN